MTSSAPWTAIRPSTMPTSPRPAASAISASRRPTTRAFTGSCWPKAIRAGRSARTATPRMRSSIRRAIISRPSATSVAANATKTGLAGYRDTYHGKAMALGRPNVGAGGRRLLRLPRLPRRPAAVRSALASFEEPTFWPPASSVMRAPPQSSRNTSRTPIPWTRSIIRCSTWCFWR